MLTQIQPIAVTFTVPQDVLPDIQARMAGGTLTVEALGSDAQKSLATGRLALVGDTIDKASGTIALKAVFENADLRLWPGQFVNARLMLTTMTGATVVPASALMLSPAGKIAYVVKSDSTVAMRVVETGVKMQDFICVTKGLSPGEMVVIDGQDSISDGAHVNIANPPTAKAVG
jgi:multidrug efflux system membrane fusion protein